MGERGSVVGWGVERACTQGGCGMQGYVRLWFMVAFKGCLLPLRRTTLGPRGPGWYRAPLAGARTARAANTSDARLAPH